MWRLILGYFWLKYDLYGPYIENDAVYLGAYES